MKGRQIVLGRLHGFEAAALFEDGQLIDLLVDPSLLTPLAPGAICRAVIERLMKGQGGCFVRLPDGHRGYLRERSGLREGQSVVVQVTGVAEDGKAIPLTTRTILRGRHVLVTPQNPGINVSRRIRDSEVREELQSLAAEVVGARPFGVILRSASVDAEPEDITAELSELVEIADRLAADASGPSELLLDGMPAWEQAWTEWSDPAPDAVEEGDDSFDRLGVLDHIEALLSPDIALGTHGTAYIEPTRAIVAVDVNTGADTSPAAGLKANIALARDLPRQLRLRGLGGQVIIDFAPVPKRDRAILDQVLRAAFKGEANETTLVGWTALGLFELSRKRERVPLSRWHRIAESQQQKRG